MGITHHNPGITPLMKIVDIDNGDGYNRNIEHKGMIIRFPKGNTSMLYDVKTINGVKIVFIRYIHYDNRKELLNLLAFAAQWWSQLKPNMVYYREKDRKNGAGKYLMKDMGFERNEVRNELKPFNCLEDGGWPCSCKVYEYIIYGINRKSTTTKQTSKQKRARAKREKNIRINSRKNLKTIV